MAPLVEKPKVSARPSKPSANPRDSLFVLFETSKLFHFHYSDSWGFGVLGLVHVNYEIFQTKIAQLLAERQLTHGFFDQIFEDNDWALDVRAPQANTFSVSLRV